MSFSRDSDAYMVYVPVEFFVCVFVCSFAYTYAYVALCVGCAG